MVLITLTISESTIQVSMCIPSVSPAVRKAKKPKILIDRPANECAQLIIIFLISQPNYILETQTIRLIKERGQRSGIDAIKYRT